MTVLGVLGGIASGKSLVARLVAGARGRVIDADELVSELYRSRDWIAELVRHFGASIVDRDGAIDRRALAARVFAAPDERRKLEALIHPRVRERIAEELARAEKERAARVVLDIPLLLENDAEHGLAQRCDLLIFVDSPLEVRDARAAANRGWPPGEVARREAAQLALDLKRRRADFVIENRSDRAALEREVARVLAAAHLDP